MKIKSLLPILAVLLILLASPLPAAASTWDDFFDDVSFWVDITTDEDEDFYETILVIDWGNGLDALVWGLIWDDDSGALDQEDLLNYIAAADDKLDITITDYQLLFASYDIDGDGDYDSNLNGFLDNDDDYYYDAALSYMEDFAPDSNYYTYPPATIIDPPVYDANGPVWTYPLWGNNMSLQLVDGGANLWTVNAGNPAGYDYPDPSPVPIPAAAWLFGSGLLGLVGLRRKLSA